MPIKVQLESEDKKSIGHMPWYWMSLISVKYPGVLWYSTEGEEAVIFSGKDVPSDLNEFPKALEKWASSQGCVGVKCLNAQRIENVPKEAEPLYSFEYQKGIENLENAEGRSKSQAKIISKVLKSRYAILEKQLQEELKAGVPLTDSKYFLALEATAFNLYKLGNIVKYGDVGRASSYVSRVYMESSYDKSTCLGPNNAPEMSIHLIRFSAIETARNDGSTREKALRFGAELQADFGEVIKLNTSPDGDGSYQILYEGKLESERARMIFYELVRQSLYKLGMDLLYEVSWQDSVNHYERSVEAIPKELAETSDANVALSFTVLNTSHPGYSKIHFMPSQDSQAEKEAKNLNGNALREFHGNAGSGFLNELSNTFFHIDENAVMNSNTIFVDDNGFSIIFKYDLAKVSGEDLIQGLFSSLDKDQKYRIDTETRLRYLDESDHTFNVSGSAKAPEVQQSNEKAIYIPAIKKVTEGPYANQFQVNPIFARMLAENLNITQKLTNPSIAEVSLKLEPSKNEPDTYEFNGTLSISKTQNSFMGRMSPYSLFARMIMRDSNNNSEIRRDILNGGIKHVYIEGTEQGVKYSFERGVPSELVTPVLGFN